MEDRTSTGGELEPSTILYITAVAIIVLAYTGYELHLEIQKSGWIEKVNGEWQIMAIGWDAYRYSWKLMAVGFLFGVALCGGTLYFFGFLKGKNAIQQDEAGQDIQRHTEDFKKEIAFLRKSDEMLKKHCAEVESKGREVQKNAERQKELTRIADERSKKAEDHAAHLMKRLEKKEKELKGARARAYRKLK